MLPTFGEFEAVDCYLIPYEKLKSGDTVIRWHEATRGYIHHRIDHYDFNTGGYVTKGDNNAFPDTSQMYRPDYVCLTKKFPK